MSIARCDVDPRVILTRERLDFVDETQGERPDRQLLFLQELTNADVASDVVEIARGIWAIHGEIPVDRDVIMAEFDTYHQARIVLDHFLHRSWQRRAADSATGHWSSE
jgi:hypothetical protein